MPKESTALRVFRLLTDKYDVVVGVYGDREGGEPSFVINVTEYGMKFSFDSNNEKYGNFLISIAKDELGEDMSNKDIRDLNKQLQSIAQVIQGSEICENGSCCCCQVDEKLDDE